MAGAHSLLLFLLARTPPDRPAVKEIKPTAAIAWSEIGYGPIHRHGVGVPLYDCPPSQAYPLSEAKTPTGDFGVSLAGRYLENVYIDVGENGLFGLGEFSALTALRQMESVTVEEVAENVVLELKGGNTGYDVISALDQAVLGPSYRAGYLRHQVIARMRRLEQEKGISSVAFEALGPPRVSKLLFEAYLLQRVSQDSMAHIRCADPQELAQAAYDELTQDQDLRSQMISIGIPILIPAGDHLLRGPVIKSETANDGWVDLRPENMRHWQLRLNRIEAMAKLEIQADGGMHSSQFDRLFVEPATDETPDNFQIGEIVAWILIYEEGGARMKA
ncbi:MAG: hypothetical protein QNJ46_19700 [Leptolyngbyaceae cyanobacterium MO_188.B28]|nr:hypothetical protein [Leptolyngbyaceae cyanobacterium MO_188.B28]